MFQRKTKAALRLLPEQSKKGVPHLDDPIETDNGQSKVRDIPFDKHPPGQPAHHDAIIPQMYCLNLWMCYDQTRHLAHQWSSWTSMSMHLPGEGCVPPSSQHPWRSATPKPW